MSMYNLAFGDTSMKLYVAKVLGFDPDTIPRYRDLWVETIPERDDALVLAIYTRTGGGNREAYMAENAAMAQHKGFIGDADDDFDSTYATFRFLVTIKDLDQSWLPIEARDTDEAYWTVLKAAAVDRVDTSQRWADAIAALEGRGR